MEGDEHGFCICLGGERGEFFVCEECCARGKVVVNVPGRRSLASSRIVWLHHKIDFKMPFVPWIVGFESPSLIVDGYIIVLDGCPSCLEMTIEKEWIKLAFVWSHRFAEISERD